MKEYMDKSLSPEKRAKALMAEMTIEDKLNQLAAQIIIADPEYYSDQSKPLYRDYTRGHVRNPGHFAHWDFENDKPKTTSTKHCAELINKDVENSIKANPHGIPVLQNGEALHGAQWGMATCFPQPIALASMFDDDMLSEVSDIIGKETKAVGVRHVFAPNVNISRDSRWGRTIETFGEDVLLASNCGAIMCRGFEQNGVIAAPKHYVANYSDGGRDSNDAHISERELREVFLKPFEKCFKEGGAKSVMTSLNTLDGVHCACNKWLITDVLRNEWGFDGFVITDYNVISKKRMVGAFAIARDVAHAEAISRKAGHDVTLANSNPELKDAVEQGLVTEEMIDASVLRVLTQKFRIGLMDEPYVDADKAQALVRCQKHKDIAYESAKKCMVLLKNDNLLPFDCKKIKKVAVFGEAANNQPIGKNYSGPFKGWRVDDAKTPLEALQEYLSGTAEVIYGNEKNVETLSKECDIALYFTTSAEGEGFDRCSLKLPSITHAVQSEDQDLVVDDSGVTVTENQQETILKMAKNNPNSCVILLTGGPVDVSDWESEVASILCAWYPGEQGAQAIAELLFGEYSPSGKLPMCFPKEAGQLPLYYSYKPSGRAYHYISNDGKPKYPFGFGLTYTTFEMSDCSIAGAGETLLVSGKIKNCGDIDADQVIQVYIGGKYCGVARPFKELKGYKRVSVPAGKTVDFSFELDKEAFYFYDAELKFDMHDCDYTIMIGSSCEDIDKTFELKIQDKKIIL